MNDPVFQNPAKLYSDDEDRIRFIENFKGNIDGQAFYSPVTGQVLNDHDWEQLGKNFKEQRFVVIDNFLKPPYVEFLRNFMLLCNVRDDLRGGYASINFFRSASERWSPLFESLTNEVASNLLKEYQPVRGWTFIYENMCKGVNLHLDPGSDITMSFWVTPVENCEFDIDKHANAFIIWDYEEDKACIDLPEEEIREKLSRSGSKPNLITYDCNRCMIFKSNFYHETRSVHMKPGYENRRISYTFLFNRI